MSQIERGGSGERAGESDRERVLGERDDESDKERIRG